MGAEQFLLTWNNHRSNFAEVFTQLRGQDQLVDVTLLCDGGSYPAHRLVLAACSPYFHQLFTKLPTQHPLVYLRDVRQTELEALLEFIYRGEVSVANNELSGLIKIAESLRIKGLGDVSQRDPSPIVPFSKSEKRTAASSTYKSAPGRSPKSQKVSELNGSSLNSSFDPDLPSVVPPPTGFGFKSELPPLQPFHEGQNAAECDRDSGDSGSPVPLSAESKLRSRLEVQDSPFGLPFTNLLSHLPGGSRLGSLLRKDIGDGKGKQQRGKIKNTEDDDVDCKEKVLMDVKQEIGCVEETSNPLMGESDGVPMPQFPKLYDAGDFGNAFLTKYTQLLSSFHQHHQQQINLQHPSPLEDEAIGGVTSLIPTTVQDQRASPVSKDVKSLRCHLCGATIKHIANFRRHMKQHLNPRRFPCPWCSAAFGRKDNLKTHTRKHHPLEVESQEQIFSGGGSVSVPSEDVGLDVFNGLPDEGRCEEPEEDDSLVIAEEKDDPGEAQRDEEGYLPVEGLKTEQN